MGLGFLKKTLRSGLLLLVFAGACLPRNLPRLTVRTIPLATVSRPMQAISPTPAPSGTETPQRINTPEPTRTAQDTQTPLPTPTLKPTETPQPTPTPAELAFPIRAAFYEPGYAQAWNQNGRNPYTRYHPGLGFYSLDDRVVIASQIAAMQYGKIQAGIAAWPGPGQGSDARVTLLMEAGSQRRFFWALQLKTERKSDPNVNDIHADLDYIRVHFGNGDVSLVKIACSQSPILCRIL